MTTSQSQADGTLATSTRILIKGGADAIDCLLSMSKGGGKLSKGLEDLVMERFGLGDAAITIVYEGRPPAAEFLDELLKAGAEPRANVPALVVLSLYPDVTQPYDGEFLAAMTEAVRLLRTAGSQVIILNASTVDPGDQTTNYAGLSHEPFSLIAQRLNLDVLRLSVAEGVSIVDVDRILAELGASSLVTGPLDYEVAACEAVCAETLRVIEEVGLFRDQLGDSGSNGDDSWMRIELPFLIGGAETVVVSRWHKNVGESVEAGDPLCDVSVTSARRLVRPTRATYLVSTDRLEGRSSTKSSPAVVRFQLTASAPVVLDQIVSEQGKPVAKGKLLAIASAPGKSHAERKPTAREKETLRRVPIRARALEASDKEVDRQ